MEDWKERIRELSFMKGYYFRMEDNGLVEKKDDQLVFEREKLEHFIQQEIEKARKEGMFDRLELSYIKTLHSEARAYRKYMGVTLTEEGEQRDKDFISKLSKLN